MPIPRESCFTEHITDACEEENRRTGGWSPLSHLSLAWGCIYCTCVHSYFFFVSCRFRGFLKCFLLEFPKPLTQQEISTKHEGFITVYSKSQQPHCSLTLCRLANCLPRHWYWSNNRQTMWGCDFPLKAVFRLQAAGCWPLLTYSSLSQQLSIWTKKQRSDDLIIRLLVV